LGYCVAILKGEFLGREALLRARRSERPPRALCCFTLAEYRPLHGGETICRRGEVLGVVTSGGYGYTVGKSIAYGYVPAEHAEARDFEIEVMGELVKAGRHDGALYDPKRRRILG
jgi:4-methylaminobutanoate oxidase (formaldehyde-forming)